jgi:uncharacterized protein with FMN-binding domain
MPKRGLAALAITAVALTLLISFKTPDQPLPDRTSGNLAIVEPSARTGTVAGPTPKPGATARPGTAARPGATATPKPATTGGGSGSATVDGPVVSTRFGPVQVELVVANGKIADVVPLQLPTGRRSGQISNYAAPILHDEALQAQSANIDFVSGATYTSDAYSQSLQAALDQAGIG